MVGPRSAGVPLPRPPLAPGDDEVRHWYENVLGWPTVPGAPLRLAAGVRFDVLDLPAEAGWAAFGRLERQGRCGRLGRGFPVALCGGRMRLLVAAGSAEELPGLLEWLEWGPPLDLDLTAIGAGGSMEAPRPAGPGGEAREGRPRGGGAGVPGGSQGAALWLRPPEPERGAGAPLPTLSAMGTRSAKGGRDSPPDLVRLVNTVATQIHRVRLRRARAGAAVEADGQPLAFS
ncbi:SCO3374 family protein [Streptomyces marokkonensis]|uniref:SCO3374 family protein n=1 Tax=Streptomyces marokkonensis TaxID=324855 RepID=UPI0011F3757E|nr:SCO3374 family protein [Streptomyces marokkonensis]